MFENNDDSKEKNFIKDFIEELTNKNLNHQNYKKDVDKCLNYIETIDLQIESNMSVRQKNLAKLEKYLNDKNIKQLIRVQEIVP